MSPSDIERRLAKVVAEVKTWEVSVPRLDINALYKFACDNYDTINYANTGKKSAFQSLTNKPFLIRITRNYLRHQLSSYEEKLERIIRLTGYQPPKTKRRSRADRFCAKHCTAAFVIIRNKIEAEITRVYPELSSQEINLKVLPQKNEEKK